MPHLIVTSISKPNKAMAEHAEGAQANRWKYIVVGDRKSPAAFELPGCQFWSLDAQKSLPFSYARVCRQDSYTRKNLGFLSAIADHAEVIVETDDDNHPLPSFWAERKAELQARRIGSRGWVNACRFFGETFCYPRGIPLHLARDSWHTVPADEAGVSCPMPTTLTNCPIQQGLADGHPDVDAVFRMLHPGEIFFTEAQPLALGPGQWCPINSQNTTWFRPSYPLLYLPATCSFRLTDIWRGFIAQRIAWEHGWHIAFHAPNVRQCRNEHNPLADFKDEIPGYLANESIARLLEALPLNTDSGDLLAQMKICYTALVSSGFLESEELTLFEAWCEDLRGICGEFNWQAARKV